MDAPVLIATYLGSPETGFTPVTDAHGHGGDRDHVPGAVVLTAGGRPVITREEWDDVNWLWPYLVQASARCRDAGSGETCFPDQPLVFRTETTGRGLLRLSLTGPGRDRRAAVTRAGDYYAALAAAGLEAFAHLERLGVNMPVAEERTLRAWLP